MAKPTAAQKRQRAREIREFLLALPLAKNSPMVSYEELVKQITYFTGLIKNLTDFIAKLTAKSIEEYSRWMHWAYSTVASATNTGKSDNANNEIYNSADDIPVDYQPELPVIKKASKATAKSRSKRKQTITPA